jgi:hypothetical protein
VTAWTILSLPPVVRRPPWTGIAFTHTRTTICDSSDRKGDAVWTSACGAVLGWEWSRVRGQVVCLADPLGIISNLSLIDVAGRPISDSKRTLMLNNLVHAINWQLEVRRCMRGIASAQRGVSMHAHVRRYAKHSVARGEQYSRSTRS